MVGARRTGLQRRRRIRCVRRNRASAIDLADLDDVLRRNLHGTIITVGAALPALRRATDPSIVTMGSITGVEAKPTGTYAHYGITKPR